MSPLDGPTWPIGWPIMLLLHSQRQPFSSCFCLGKLVWGAHLNLFSFEQIVDRSFLCKCIWVFSGADGAITIGTSSVLNTSASLGRAGSLRVLVLQHYLLVGGFKHFVC